MKKKPRKSLRRLTAREEILSDKKMMQDISESLHEIKKGEKGRDWREVLK